VSVGCTRWGQGSNSQKFSIKVEGASAASARCKTGPGDESAALKPDGAVAAFVDTAAVPIGKIHRSSYVVQDTN